jgi:hypothetical protein
MAPEVQDALAAFVLDMEGVLEPGVASTLLTGLPDLGLILQAKLYLQVMISFGRHSYKEMGLKLEEIEWDEPGPARSWRV